jgi:hypothetical protein
MEIRLSQKQIDHISAEGLPCYDDVDPPLHCVIPCGDAFAVRVLPEDIPFPCGIGCCGIEKYGVLVVKDIPTFPEDLIS